MSEILLSLITINYQNRSGLEATVDSVVQQENIAGWEWLVIDGGSSDGSVDFIKEHKTRFHYWVSESDKGIYDAMNKGLNQAKGRFVWFLNSGDRLHDKRAIKTVINAIERQPEVDCWYSDTYFVDDNYHIIGLISKLKPQKYPEKLTFESFRYGMNICHQSMVARRSMVSEYSLNYRQASDIDWVLRFLKQKPVCKSLNVVLSEFQTGGSSSQHARKALRERYQILNVHFGFLPNFLAHVWIAVRRFFSRGKY